MATTNETAEQRTARFIDELDAIDLMTVSEANAACERLAREDGFLAFIAGAALVKART